MNTKDSQPTDLPPDDLPQPSSSDKVAHHYDFDIDLKVDSTHTTVVRLVGSNQRVLELGPATGYMSKAFHEQGCSIVGIEIDPGMAQLASKYCERMIVGDLDSIDLDRELESERFDVIVAADVLEHLKNPLDVLRRLRRFLADDKAFFVISLPNIAHGSVRLALLEGHFSYTDAGLLDRTHLRFFTKASMEELFDEADLAIVEASRRNLNIDASEVVYDSGGISDDIIRAIEDDPDAHTYQFVFKAIPLDWPGMREVQRRLRDQALALDTARLSLARLENEVSRAGDEASHAHDLQVAHAHDLEVALAAITAREGQIRTIL